MVVVVNSVLNFMPKGPPRGLVLGYASNISAQQVLDATNGERAKLGLAPLKLNAALSKAAAAKAADMFAHNYWAHINPNGTTPWFFIRQAGYTYTVAGENLARDFDTTDAMVAAWMASPTHKANIIHTKYQDTGIAVVNGKLDGVETTLVVHMFGKSASGAAVNKPKSVKPQISAGENIQVNQPEVAGDTTQNLPTANLPEPEKISNGGILISPLLIKRILALAILAVIGGVLLVDEWLINQRKTVRFVGKNWAHFGLVVVIILIVLTISRPGGVL
jgi:hypothetical protein